MDIAVLVCTYGSDEWRDLAYSRAYQSALGQECSVHAWHEPEGTLASSRNNAAASVDDGWLVFLDADDELAFGYIAMMRDAVAGLFPATTTPVLLAPAVQRMYNAYSGSAPSIPNKGSWPKMNECVIGTMLGKRLFDRVGGFRELPSLEDYDLFLRCYDIGAKIVYVPDAVYREHVSHGGRNLDQSIYPALWAEHLERIS